MVTDDERRKVAAGLRADHRQDHESQVTFIARMVTGKDRVTVVDVVRLPKTLADLIDPEGETMISDDQRREVAKRLRNGGIARNSEEAYVLLLSRIGIRPQLPATNTYEDAMSRLADLIDRPTCDDVGDDWTFRCSACGCELDIRDMEVGEPTMWNDGAAKVPNYCPDCGANVVMTSD